MQRCARSVARGGVCANAGVAGTSVYSNLIPIVAMLTALVWLGEPLSASKIVGAAAVLLGVALTRTAEP